MLALAPLRRSGRAVLDEIATPFMQTRLALGLPIDATALAAAASKEELLGEAKSAGIEGRSSMTKDDLAEALVAAMR